MAILDESYKGPKLDKKTLTDWRIGNAMKQADKYRQESARYGGGSTMGAANYVAGRVVDNPLVSLRGATDVFSSAGGRAMAAPEAKRFIEAPTKAQLGGAIAQTALTLYPGATIAKAGKFAVGSLLGKIASKGAEKAVTGAATSLVKSNVNRGLSKLAGNVAAFGGAGYGYEASQNLIEGKTGSEAYTPGVQTAVSAALPFTPIAFTGAKKVLGRAAQEAFGATTGAGMGVVRAAYEAAKEGGEKAAAFTKAMRGNTSPEEIVGAAKESLGEIIQKRSADYEQALSKVAGMTEQIDTTPVAKAIENGLAKFGVKVTADGLDFSRSTLRFNKKAQEEIKTIVDEMAQFGSKEGDNTALGVDRLKRAFSDLYSDSSEARAFVANVTGETRKLLSKVPGYDEMAKAYGDSTGLIKEIQKGLSLGNKASVDTAFRKLSTTLRTNNEFRQQLVEELDKISGGTLSAQIAGQQLSEVVPRGLAKVGIAGAGAIGLATGGLGVVALLKLAATSSPRLIGEFANALGIGAKAFNKFLQGIGVKAGVDAVQKTRLPGDIILDSPFGKKLKEGVKSMKGKGGLSIQDVTKQPGYDPLLQEAGKYKTTLNLQDKDDVAYLRQIFSDDIVNEIKSGKTTNWRGENYSDIARVNFISEVPQTVEQKLAGKIKDAKLNSDTFYHGTSSGSADSIMASGFKPGSKLPANAYRGGGYGKTQSTVSFAETPKEAGIFSTLTKYGKIVEAKLKPNARVVSIEGIEDAVDLEDYIGYLRKQKIDAVYIGGGEKELVVINPKAVTPTKSQLTDLWGEANKKLSKNTERNIKVSDSNNELLKNHTFSLNADGYPVTNKGGKVVYLHDLVMGTEKAKGFDIDHINGNKLDNRVENLRVVTHQANGFNAGLSKNNTSGVKGVKWDGRINKWIASISPDGKTVHLGSFANIDDAVKARKAGEVKYTSHLYNKAQGTKRGFGTGAGRGAEDKTQLLTDSKEKLSNFLKGLKTDKMNESDAAEFIKETEKMLKPTMSASRIKSYMEDVQFEIDKVLKERGKESLKGERVKSLIQSAAKAENYMAWLKDEGLKASETMKQLYLDAKGKLRK